VEADERDWWRDCDGLLKECDLDNLLKPTLDLLVRHQVIPDDSTQFLMSFPSRLEMQRQGWT